MRALDGRVVLVTGSLGTLGRAICQAIEGAGGTALGTDIAPGADFRHDVTDPAAWKAVAAQIAEIHGRLDGLVNNAGIVHLGSIEETSFADWRRVMSVNADGVFLGCQACWPVLRQSPAPSIVNISSVSGLVGGANLAAYNASKGAVRLLTKSVALHGARHDPPIRCNSVHPVFVEGAMVDQITAATGDPDRSRGKMERAIPMRRLARPAEVAASVLHLLSSESAFTTGTEMVIDGGLIAG